MLFITIVQDVNAKSKKLLCALQNETIRQKFPFREFVSNNDDKYRKVIYEN